MASHTRGRDRVAFNAAWDKIAALNERIIDAARAAVGLQPVPKSRDETE